MISLPFTISPTLYVAGVLYKLLCPVPTWLTSPSCVLYAWLTVVCDTPNSLAKAVCVLYVLPLYSTFILFGLSPKLGLANPTLPNPSKLPLLIRCCDTFLKVVL